MKKEEEGIEEREKGEGNGVGRPSHRLLWGMGEGKRKKFLKGRGGGGIKKINAPLPPTDLTPGSGRQNEWARERKKMKGRRKPPMAIQNPLKRCLCLPRSQRRRGKKKVTDGLILRSTFNRTPGKRGKEEKINPEENGVVFSVRCSNFPGFNHPIVGENKKEKKKKRTSG